MHVLYNMSRFAANIDRNKILRPVLFVIFLLMPLLPSIANASRFILQDGTVVSRSETVDDDLYVFGNFVEFYGVIDGDLSVFCFDIEEEGEVLGNVNLFAYKVDMAGLVDKSARLFGNDITVRGQINRNLLAFGREIEVTKKAVISRDLTCAGAIVTLKGQIDGDVDVDADVVLISGRIGGDVKIDAEEVYIGYPAVIEGDLVYTSAMEAEVEEEVLINGTIVHELPEEKEEPGGFLAPIRPVLRILLFFMALITGFAMILLFNRHTHESTEQIEKRFWPTLAAGLLTLIVVIMGAIILTALVISIPLAVILISLGTLLFYIGKIYVSIIIGRLVFKIFSRTSRIALGWELIVGLIILSLVFRIPVVGTIVYLLAFIIGAGAAIMGYLSLNKKFKRAAQQQPGPEAAPQTQ
jgi:cytoskeletal protein CcmA (bactofilin family)